MVNLLHVVTVFQHIDQAQQFRRGFRIHFGFGRGDHGHFRGVGFKARRFQRIAHRAHLFPCGKHVNRAVIVTDHVFCARFQRRFHHRIFVMTGCEGDYAFFAEQIGDGAIGTQVAARFGEGVTHFAHGTVTVVAQALNHDGRSARTVTFINDGFHIGVIFATYAACNGTVHGIARHVIRQRFIHCRTQARVGARIAAAQFGSRDQLTNDLRKDFTALGVLSGLTVLGIRPFTVSSHVAFSPIFYWVQAILRANVSPGRARNSHVQKYDPLRCAGGGHPRGADYA
ncbi:hypothetical protein PAJ_1518 [Pantoea ananatis AJ13355]|uniref:Uncharacterized protein n=1 Tax=Pantoea ananatis (strain AJ13355) TaxID=932677 RepID=A0A0H3KX06_PANAA|nr:hypothetical protein PAJ_1518 [Pantoea ananatis AJ13355]